MCWQQVAMQGGQMAMGGFAQNQQTAATVDQMRRQKIQLLKEMNFNETNFNLEQRDLMDNTVQQLNSMNLTNVRNMGTVRAAIGESNLQGASMDRIMRVTEGDNIRSAMNLNDNYERDYAVILGKKYGNYANTLNQFQAMGEEPRVRSTLEQILDPLNIGIGQKLLKFSGKYIPGGKGFDRTLNKTFNLGSSGIDPHGQQ